MSQARPSAPEFSPGNLEPLLRFFDAGGVRGCAERPAHARVSDGENKLPKARRELLKCHRTTVEQDHSAGNGSRLVHGPAWRSGSVFGLLRGKHKIALFERFLRKRERQR